MNYHYPGELERLQLRARSQLGIPVPLALIDALQSHFGKERICDYFEISPPAS